MTLSGIGLWDRIEEIKHGGRGNYWETGAEFQTQTIKVATEGKSRGAFAIETLQKNPEEQADESRAGGSWKNWVTCKVVNGTLWESYRCRQSSWSWSLTPRRLPLMPSRKVFVETTCWLCSISTWCYWLWGSQRLTPCGTQGSKGEVLEQCHRLCLGAQGGIFFRNLSRSLRELTKYWLFIRPFSATWIINSPLPAATPLLSTAPSVF